MIGRSMILPLFLLLHGCTGTGKDAPSAQDGDGDGYTVAEGDCDDGAVQVHPDATDEIVDGVDQDCDGLDGPDADEDGYVDGAAGGDDCDDRDAEVHPGAAEVWDDGLDQDCDGVPDVAGASCTSDLVLRLSDGSTVDIDGCKAWRVVAGVDYDPDAAPAITSLYLSLNGVTGDGAECLVWIEQEGVCGAGFYDLRDEDHSDGAIVTSDCPGVSGTEEGTYSVTSGYVRLDTLDAPGLASAASEDAVSFALVGGMRATSGSGVSLSGSFALGLTVPTQDVDGMETCLVTDGDEDGDGYPSDYFDGGDCDDQNAGVRPGVPDTWYDGVDSDCGGEDDYDADGDGHRPWAHGGRDCDDNDARSYPGAVETWYDGIDGDCAGGDDYDADGDGHRPAAYGGQDCDDTAARLTPEDADADGWSSCDGDCDDSDSGTYPYDPDGDGVESACGWFSVSAGEYFSCAIDNRGLQCWGIDNGSYTLDYGQVRDAPEGEHLAMVAGGEFHACALDWDGQVRCWGGDSHGQSSGVPSVPLQTVSAGWYHSCGLDTRGRVQCWGIEDGSANDYGQVSDAPAGTFEQIDAGLFHTCALDNSGGVQCWGNDTYGQVSGTPGGTFLQLAVGGFHACALDTAGSVSCWGRDDQGQTSTAPSGAFVAISAGGHHACLLDAAGGIECFGYNLSGATSRAPSGSWSSLALGGYHGCAIGTDGALACWGHNEFGQVSEAP
jgi:hypothetical protein